MSLHLPSVAFVVLATLALTSCPISAERIKYQTNVKRDPNKLNVHIVCHTHDDAGWLKTVDQYYYGARQDIQLAGVQFIITSVIQALRDNPNRKFVYAEMAFFTRWWADQNDEIKQLVKDLVDKGQLDFVNGGYVQHDEAAAHYVAMIDQTTRGHRFLNETFGKKVKIGWQVDPFGHSATQAALMSAVVGFDALFFGRADYQDMDLRRQERRMEMVWRASQSWGRSAEVFTHNNLDGNYSPPPGFWMEWGSWDAPMIDDPESPDYNVPQRVAWFVALVTQMATVTRGNDVIVLMGTDFTYANANPWYINLDRLIHFVNEEGTVNAFYSTPAEFIDAKKAYDTAQVQWPLKTDDFFPYADCPHCYWTGYFTSRPTSKRFIRAATSYLQVARQLEALAGMEVGGTDELEAAVSLTQHHDSITGTAKQHVANDYHRRLAKGWAKAEGVVNCALAKILTNTTRSLPVDEATPRIPTSRRLTAASATDTSHRITPPTTTVPPAANLLLSQCQYINASICDVTVHATSHGLDLVVVLYNPLGWPRTEWVQLPIGSGPYSWQVQDSNGLNVTDQLLPMHDSTKAIQQALLISGEQNDLSTFATQKLAWRADLPALGLKTFHVRSFPSPSLARLPEPLQLAPPTSETLQISNSRLSLNFSPESGLLQYIEAADGSWTLPVVQELMWYWGSDGREPEQGGLGSGAYIFRPPMKGPQAPQPISPGPVKVEVVRGPLVQEVHQHFASWAHLTTRLWGEEGWVEQEWTVGPIPIEDQVAREVITRFTTNLDTKGTLYTDSNGREMLRRVRNQRPSWNLTVTEPVAGNYYPITSAVAIEDENVRLTVATERGQGAASLEDGQLEIMLHRRCVQDDQRGVGENLNETQCYCRDCRCQGLTARGTHILSIEPLATAAATARKLQVQLNDPPVMAFATAPQPTTTQERSSSHLGSTPLPPSSLPPMRGEVSFLADVAGLPENVHLLTLKKLHASHLLLRVAHNLQTGEHPVLAKPVKVNLSQLLTSFQVKDIKELSLSANQYVADMAPRHTWPVEDTERTRATEAAMQVVKQYDISKHDDQMPVVQLHPMEIRSFEVEIA